MDKKFVIVYDCVNHILSREKMDLENPDAIGDRLDIVGCGTNMYNTKRVGFKYDQKLCVYYNASIDWKDKEAYSPIGFMGELFNNIIVVAALNPNTDNFEDMKMTTNEAYAEVKNFQSCEFGWEILGEKI